MESYGPYKDNLDGLEKDLKACLDNPEIAASIIGWENPTYNEIMGHFEEWQEMAEGYRNEFGEEIK